jgi:hypothetical protein
MAGPGAVLVAGAITTSIAFSTFDGLVAQDYYKQGLAVNKVLEREQAAARMGLAADIALAGDRHRLVVNLHGADPAEIGVRFAHATRAGHDFSMRLARTGPGRYEGAVPQMLPPGRWNVQVEGGGNTSAWRLAGDWSGRDAGFRLGH